MGEGKFREDLYYRLRVVEIQLPSLRERPTDIPALAMTFLREFAEQNRKKVTEFTKEALDAIVRHSWPGNVRELRAAVEHALVFAKGKKVELFDLPASMRSQAGLVHAEPAGEASALGALPGGNALGGPFSNLSVEENEKQLMIQALKRTSGNRTEAAKLLGISRRTLHRKMARFKLN